MVRFLQCWPSCSLFLALSHWASNLIVGSRPRLVPKCPPPKQDLANVLIDDKGEIRNKNPIPVPLSQGLHEFVSKFIPIFWGGMKQCKSMQIYGHFGNISLNAVFGLVSYIDAGFMGNFRDSSLNFLQGCFFHNESLLRRTGHSTTSATGPSP